VRYIILLSISLGTLTIAHPQASTEAQGSTPHSGETNYYTYDEKIHNTADCGKDRATKNTSGRGCWDLFGTGWYKKDKGCLSPADMQKEKGWGLCYY